MFFFYVTDTLQLVLEGPGILSLTSALWVSSRDSGISLMTTKIQIWVNSTVAEATAAHSCSPSSGLVIQRAVISWCVVLLLRDISFQILRHIYILVFQFSLQLGILIQNIPFSTLVRAGGKHVTQRRSTDAYQQLVPFTVSLKYIAISTTSSPLQPYNATELGDTRPYESSI